MFHFRSLGSGSSGNSYLIQTTEGSFLIDAGIPIRRLRRSLTESGTSLASLKAILLTHDHMDHAANAGTLQLLAKRKGWHIDVRLTELTLQGILDNPAIRHKPDSDDLHLIQKNQPFSLCGATIEPFDVPHDSRDCCGYLITYHDLRLCLLTDCGDITPEIETYVARATHLIVEANYDSLMLLSGPYPERLKHRILSAGGHLSNERAAGLVAQHRKHLSAVWLCHLSQNNNTPRRALQTVLDTLRPHDLFDPTITALPRLIPSDTFVLEK